jgi:hypothetical protein
MHSSLHCSGCLSRGTLIHYSPQQERCAVCGDSRLLPICELEPEPPTTDQLLADPACSYWLKYALSSALTRDPVDAANDAEVLARLLDARCRKLLSEG